MLELKTILVPTDFSGCADAAVGLAFDFATRCKSTLHLLHVNENRYRIDEPHGTHPFMDVWSEDLQTPGHGPLQMSWNRTAVVAETVSTTDPTGAILSAITRRDVDLLVMGTHGNQSVRRFLNDTPDVWGIGKTAEGVMPEARCAVLSVGPQASRSQAIECVVAPVDLRSHSAFVAAHAAAVANLYDAPLQLVHVVQPGASNEDRAATLRALQSLSTEADLPERTTFKIISGIPAEAIAKHLRTRPNCLLVLGTHGMKGRGDKQIGSVADTLIRSAPCLVLTVKPFGRPLISMVSAQGHEPSWPGSKPLSS